jgi:hypothetical protein
MLEHVGLAVTYQEAEIGRDALRGTSNSLDHRGVHLDPGGSPTAKLPWTKPFGGRPGRGLAVAAMV